MEYPEEAHDFSVECWLTVFSHKSNIDTPYLRPYKSKAGGLTTSLSKSH